MCKDLLTKRRPSSIRVKKTYKRQIIVNDDMVIVTHRKSVVYHNKPYYIGFSILYISKYIMYDYYYNVLRQYFVEHEKVQLLYSDTDSFVLKIRSEDIFSDLKCLSPTFDFSNLPLTIICLMQQRNLNCTILKKNLGYYPYYDLYPWGQKFMQFKQYAAMILIYRYLANVVLIYVIILIRKINIICHAQIN